MARLHTGPNWVNIQVMSAVGAAPALEEDAPIPDIPALPYEPVTPRETLEKAVDAAFKRYVASLHSTCDA